MRFRLICFLASAMWFANAPASARTIHIVAFGDSVTACWLVAHQDAYPAQLQVALRKKGYDIAIVEFSTNDLRSGASMKSVRTRMTEIIRSFRARKIEVLVVGLDGLDLSTAAKENNVLYARWKLPLGKYRARDGAHYNEQGCAIVVAYAAFARDADRARRAAITYPQASAVQPDEVRQRPYPRSCISCGDAIAVGGTKLFDCC
jgi:hypothetical protein